MLCIGRYAAVNFPFIPHRSSQSSSSSSRSCSLGRHVAPPWPRGMACLGRNRSSVYGIVWSTCLPI